MNRYLCILLGALLFAACEPTTPKQPDVAFCFGPVEVTTTESSASIDLLKPYITLDGVKYDDAVISLEYFADGNEASPTRVTQYSASSIEGHILFEIEGLEPNTRYEGYICIEDSKYGSQHGDSFPFTTQEHISTYAVRCDTEVVTKGIVATITLNSVAYLVDGVEQEIESVALEYARRGATIEWTKHDVTGKQLIELPSNGDDYLYEKSKYLYRVTVTPKSADLEPLTSEQKEFETEYAEVTANISQPVVTLQGDMVCVVVDSVEVLFDGVKLDDYHYLDYYIYYRESGSEGFVWDSELDVEKEDGGLSLKLDVDAFASGKEYEFAAVVVAGAERKLRMSEITTFAIPEQGGNTPPTPPVSGDADTSDLVGTWHLTQWRGAEPSFDVYMSITEDGVVTLYQRIESRAWELFYSTVEFEDGIISGTYTDGVEWGASYSVALDGDTMVWTDTLDATDISIYTRAELPDGLPQSQSAVTRSSVERFL